MEPQALGDTVPCLSLPRIPGSHYMWPHCLLPTPQSFFLAWGLHTECLSSPLVILCIILFYFLRRTYNHVQIYYLFTSQGFFRSHFGSLFLSVSTAQSLPTMQASQELGHVPHCIPVA